jgi:hypothetical protein
MSPKTQRPDRFSTRTPYRRVTEQAHNGDEGDRAKRGAAAK